jgi:hypothetical protein
MPYCKALHNHLFVDVQGYYAPCCFYIDIYTDDYNVQFTKDYTYNLELHNKLKQIISKQDKLFHTQIKDYIPEIAKWI